MNEVGGTRRHSALDLVPIHACLPTVRGPRLNEFIKTSGSIFLPNDAMDARSICFAIMTATINPK
jgi:hypothetical protein